MLNAQNKPNHQPQASHKEKVIANSFFHTFAELRFSKFRQFPRTGHIFPSSGVRFELNQNSGRQYNLSDRAV
jgi:hypothetical protein